MNQKVSEVIKQSIFEAVKTTFSDVDLKLEDISLEHPAAEEHGDYATSVALKLRVKNEKLKVAPREIAEGLVSSLKRSHLARLVEKIEVAGAGFINFWLSKEVLEGEMEQIVEQKESFGRNDQLRGKKMMVEFAHPNTHKQFHIGHLRNITIGESIIRILAASAAEMVRTNYQGDVGMHVAKALWGVQHLHECYLEARNKDTRERVAFLGKAYVLGSESFEKDEKAKAEIIEINRAIYSKEPKIMAVWQETRQWSLDYFQLIYTRVYTTFDRLYFESEVYERGKELVLENIGKIFEKSDGAVIFKGAHTRVFINSEGNPTYEAKDMGLGELQFAEYHPDLLIHNLGPEQLGYTEVMFEALARLFPETRGKEMHLPYGWVRLKQGKMSSRTGNVVLGEWLLDEIKKRLEKKYPDKVSETEPIAVAAAKYSLLKVGREQEIAFDIDESINLDGDSGPYLQYTYARARSVIRKSENSENSDKRKIRKADRLSAPNTLKPEELAILRYLYRFPEVVEQAAKTYSPNLICSYLFEMAKKFNAFYNEVPILNSDEKGFRLNLVVATAQVLRNGLYLLGIEALERM